MYDFYNNPPKTKQDLRDYLTSWLEKVDDIYPIVINGETFFQELGFRRAFYHHSVLRNVSTNQYVWWVFEKPDIKMFPEKRYATYEELLEDVINDYYVKWRLNE